jgi:transcriptional regulator with XRE-family HTH domain
MKKISQNDLAAAIGISASMLSRLKKRGMPVDSLPAARAWRKRHLNTSLTKPYRYTPFRDAPRATKQPQAPITAGDVNALGRLAEKHFDEYAGRLRDAMRRLPRADRPQVSLPLDVLEALCGAQIKKFEDWEKANGIEPCPPKTAEELADPEYDPDDEAGNFMFDIAAGIVRFKEREEL